MLVHKCVHHIHIIEQKAGAPLQICLCRQGSRKCETLEEAGLDDFRNIPAFIHCFGSEGRPLTRTSSVCNLGVIWLPPFLLWVFSCHNEVRSLGILLDSVLSMESQIMSVVHTTHCYLRQIAQRCPYLDTESLSTLVHALVVLRLDYL